MKKGISLIELIIYLAIAAIILPLISSSFLLSFRLQQRSDLVMNVSNEGENIVHAISQIVRNAVEITNPLLKQTANQLTLTVTDASKTPTIISLSNGVIKIQEGATSLALFQSGSATASGLQFTNVGQGGTPGSIAFDFTLTSGTVTKSFHGSATLRKNR